MADATGTQNTQEAAQEGQEEGGKRKHLSNAERNAVLQALLARSDGAKNLNHGAVNAVAKQFGRSRQCISGIWKRGLESVANGSTAMVVDHRKKLCGRKKKDHSEAIANMANIPVNRRSTIRATASALGISCYAVHSMTKGNDINRISSAVKPTLREHHYQERIDYCLRQIDLNTMRFKANFDVVHIDEKWFFVTEETKTYYLAPGEAPPERSVGHKSHIPKIMFISAVARPRRCSTSNTYFDGKLGIWPIATWVPAQRSSRNRPRGTMELKPVSLNAEVYNKLLLDHVIPAINEKWPQHYRNRRIYLQQDNAPPHKDATNTNPELAAAIAATGLDIVFANQPAQSPDTNVLDLGYFRSIESLQQSKRTRNVAEMNVAVKQSFEELDKSKLERIFLTHQAVCREILLHNGGNQFKLPHMKKDATIRRRGSLPVAIRVDAPLEDKIRELRPALLGPAPAAAAAEEPLQGVAV